MVRSVLRPLLLSLVLLSVSTAHAQTTYYPAKGVWNGFLSQLNISECDSTSNRPIELTLTMVNAAGVQVAQRTFLVPAFGSVHTILNDLAPITDDLGVYTLSLKSGQEALGDSLHCRTVFYRTAPLGSAKQFDYAYSLPVQNPQSGILSGIYNSFDPSGGDNISYNWLSVINFDSTPFSATVQIFDAGGALEGTVPVIDLPPGGRQDIALGHPKGQTSGLYKVVPNDAAKRYDASLIRYNISPSGNYNFAFPLRGTRGSCTGQPVLASTMGNGLTKNWLEIANANDIPITVRVEVRDGVGALVHEERPTVLPRGQHHIYLSDKIDPAGIGNVGSARVLCDDPTDSLIIQSTFYGALPGSFPVEWAYSTQELGRLPAHSGAKVTAPVNTFVGMANWFKFADGSLRPSTLNFTLFDQSGAALAQGEQALPSGGTADLGLHALLPPDQVGSATISSSTNSAAYSGEMLRVLSRSDGQIGNIISIPGIVTQNGISGGAFRGDPQSLAPYRDKIQYAEAQRLLTAAAFGGSDADIARALSDGLSKTVDRLVDVPMPGGALRAEADDWIDGQFQNTTEGTPRHYGIRRWWLTYILKSPYPLREKLALFWHDRFASSCRVLSDGLEMQRCVDHMQLLRTSALGNYRSLLKAMTIDYLMLVWLNGEKNVKQSPDENYAREIMELFSLGEKQRYGKGLRYSLYSETGEIPEFARALTGYTTQFVNDQFGQDYVVAFVLNRHDTGTKTVWPGTPYEASGAFTPNDVADVILNQRPRDVGRYIGGALFTLFCHDHPGEQLKAQMADILISSGWQIRPLVRRILKSEACFSPDAYKARMMDPVTFAVGFLKKTKIPMSVTRLADALARMGMDITNPPDVFGWEAGFREAQYNGTAFWNAYPVEYANFVTLALRSHESDFRDPDTGAPLFDFCSLNPSPRARSEEVVDHISGLMGLSLTGKEREEYLRYIDNDLTGFTTDGDAIERPALYDPRVPERCRTKLGGLLWLMSTNPRALTY